MTDAPADDDDDELLQPSIRRVGLSNEVRRRRRVQEQIDASDRRLYEPALIVNIDATARALDFLERVHQWLADELDFDLVGDTRPAAIWQLSGRCIGLCRLVLDAVRLGYGTETMLVARGIHELDQLVEALADPHEGDLLRTWLADEGMDYVSPKRARAAERRGEERLREFMRGIGREELPSTKELAADLYGRQSAAAHHRRKWTQDNVFPGLRTMVRGPETSWRRRAGNAGAYLAIVEGALMTTGDMLGRFFGPTWYESQVKPVLSALEQARKSHPLP